jgi:hypothetical protein
MGGTASSSENASPKLSFGDVLAKAKARTSSTLTDDFSLSSELRRSPETRPSLHARSGTQGSKATSARQVEFQILDSNSTQVMGRGFRRQIEITKEKSRFNMGQAQTGLPYSHDTTVPKCARLVSLFARSGTWTANPRAPHISSQAAAASSIAKKPMERANSNGGPNRPGKHQQQARRRSRIYGRTSGVSASSLWV